MLALNRGTFRTSDSAPGRPQAREGEERPVLGEGKPRRRLTRPGVLVLAEGRGRHEAAVLRSQPPAPVRARDVADVGDGLAPILRRSGHAPAGHDEFTFAIHSVADNRRELIREDTREQWLIAGAVILRPKPVTNSRLALGQGIEITHARWSLACVDSRAA